MLGVTLYITINSMGLQEEILWVMQNASRAGLLDLAENIWPISALVHTGSRILRNKPWKYTNVSFT